MSLRSLVPSLILVFFVALGGTFLALRLFGEQAPSSIQDPRVVPVTVEVIITATPNPNFTPPVIIVTATIDRTQVALPPNLLAATSVAQVDRSAVPTIDPTLLGADEAIGLTATSLPQNCLLHVIATGDTPFGIAQEYGANPFLLMEINGLDDEAATRLRIGDTLIVPLEGCTLTADQVASTTGASAQSATDSSDASAEATAEALPEAQLTATSTPTLAPTAVNAQITIIGVENAGDVTAEGVRIRNSGNTVDLTGWRLVDLDDNEYVFTERLLFSNQEITIYTRTGTDTPVAYYWNLDRPVWDPGDVLTLFDRDGDVQATLRIEQPINLTPRASG